MHKNTDVCFNSKVAAAGDGFIRKMVQLDGLQTEGRNSQTANIDRVSVDELCRILNNQDAKIPTAVESCIPVIAQVIEVLTERTRKGGRLFYIGAGTSGRLGVLDASEIPPTYSASADQFVALIAGGDYALRKAREGAEDSRSGAVADLQPYSLNPELDALIGIASSGRTPYVLGGLEYAKSLGCVTIGLVCVEPSAVGSEGNADFLIAPVTGPEVVTGSTRMKAGTATKLVLNMISTGIMITMGKTYGNMMIDVKATNDKLKQRAKNILRFVGGKSCTQSDEELEKILEACHGSVKLAAATVVLKVSVSEAEERLQRNNGVLARVLEEKNQKITEGHLSDLVLCVDAGGTSCKAAIMSPDGVKRMGSAGPCNVSTIGLDAAMDTVSKAVQHALDSHHDTKGHTLQSITFKQVWVGMAGFERPYLKPLIQSALSNLFRLRLAEGLKVSSDIDILPSALSAKSEIDNVVVLIAGTGSIAQSYYRDGRNFQKTGRAGGWGRLLGDDGSGYDIGRLAIRKTLHMCDSHRLSPATGNTLFTPLTQAVLQHFQRQHPGCTPDTLLDTLLLPDPSFRNPNGDMTTTKSIASAAEIVLSMANKDLEAKKIVDSAVKSIVPLVTTLVEGRDLDLTNCALVMGGGLLANRDYRSQIIDGIELKHGQLRCVKFIDDPASFGAQSLLGSGLP